MNYRKEKFSELLASVFNNIGTILISLTKELLVALGFDPRPESVEVFRSHVPILAKSPTRFVRDPSRKPFSLNASASSAPSTALGARFEDNSLAERMSTSRSARGARPPATGVLSEI